MRASEKEDIERIVLLLVETAETNMSEIVDAAIAKIKTLEFDGNKWSTLALSILESFGWPEKPGEILKALLDYDAENGAYLNNFGLFLEVRGQIGGAIEYYARAYATDYKAHGHERATGFPAWSNLCRITSGLKSSR
jgi:Tfp pilus assembly protein PilF